MATHDLPRDLFVYGTLKRGQPAHRRYCGDAIFIASGTVLGRLHRHPDGYPVLVLAPSPLVTSPDWRWVCGEIFRLRDPARSLARIDAYEGVIVGLSRAYRRVHVAVRAAGVRFAWVYAAACPLQAAALPVHPASSWP